MRDEPNYNRFMDYLLFRSLKGETGAAEEEKVLEWRRSAPENEAHYSELERLLALTADAYRRPDEHVRPRPDATELVRRAEASGEAADRAAGPELGSGQRRRWGFWLGGAIAAVAAVALLMVLQPSPPPRELLSFGVDEFATGANDVATVQLQDGTIVRLAPRSRLRLTGSAGEREVTLDGRAYFVVASMEGLPFTVKGRAGDAVVLGTRFEVEAREDELWLLVVEGRVALSAPGSRVEVGAGEMARTVQGALSAPVRVPDAHRMLEWTDNFLVFQRTPIQEVAAEIERHYGIRVEVIGRDLARQTVTAWFADAAFEDVMRVVCKVLTATCSKDEGKATIDLSHSSPLSRRSLL